MSTILSSKERFTITQRKSAEANTSKTGRDVRIVIFLKPACQALSAYGILE